MEKLRLVDVRKKFKDKLVLSGIDFCINEGERVSILGPSGCGKSTLLKIMAGLLEHEGDIFLNGKSIKSMPTNKRNIVVVDQDNLLFPHMTVYDNIAFGLKVRKVDKSEIDKKVKSLLHEIELSGYEDKKISKLSGGEKQRVALARALAVNPEVLLLDEAYSSLDTNLRGKMRELTIKLQKKHSITTILVTHDKSEAITFSDKIAVMLNGRFEQYDVVRKVYETPTNLAVAKFMFDRNFINIDDEVIFIKAEDVKIIKTYDDNSDFASVIKGYEDKDSTNATKDYEGNDGINATKYYEGNDGINATKYYEENDSTIDINNKDDKYIEDSYIIFDAVVVGCEYVGSKVMCTVDLNGCSQSLTFECDKKKDILVGDKLRILVSDFISYKL